MNATNDPMLTQVRVIIKNDGTDGNLDYISEIMLVTELPPNSLLGFDISALMVSLIGPKVEDPAYIVPWDSRLNGSSVTDYSSVLSLDPNVAQSIILTLSFDNIQSPPSAPTGVFENSIEKVSVSVNGNVYEIGGYVEDPNSFNRSIGYLVEHAEP